MACANVERGRPRRADIVETYEGYAFDHAVDYVAGWREAVRRLAERLGVGGRIAGERGFVPAGLEGLLAVDGALDLSRPEAGARHQDARPSS